MPDLGPIADRFAALGHAARLAILREILRAHPDGLVVSEIQERVGLPGSTLSHHLDALRQAGIVSSSREAQRIRYRARVEGLREMLGYLQNECCSDRRGALLAEITAPRRSRRRP